MLGCGVWRPTLQKEVCSGKSRQAAREGPRDALGARVAKVRNAQRPFRTLSQHRLACLQRVLLLRSVDVVTVAVEAAGGTFFESPLQLGGPIGLWEMNLGVWDTAGLFRCGASGC